MFIGLISLFLSYTPPNITGNTISNTIAGSNSWNNLNLDRINGFTQEIKLGTILGSTTAFGTSVRETRIRGFTQGNLPISIRSISSSPRYHEQLNFDPSTTSGCYVTTGLALGDINKSNDAYGSNPVLYGPSGCMDYQFKFDDSLTLGNYISDSNAINPILLPFLGQNFLIEGAPASNQINVAIGKIFTMAVNDVVNFDGHNFTLNTIGASAVAIISSACPGNSILVSNNRQINCGNYVIRVTDIISGGTGISGTPTAKITILVNGGRTYYSGDPYINQDINRPFWSWKLADLNSPNNVYISTQLGQSLTSYSGPDTPNYLLPRRLPGPGDKLCWPNNYVCISFDKMSQKTADFGKYRIKVDVKDLYDSNDRVKLASAQSVILIESLNNIRNNGIKDINSKNTDTLAIWLDRQPRALAFTKSSTTGHLLLIKSLINSNVQTYMSTDGQRRMNPDTQIGSINYKNTNFKINANFKYTGGPNKWPINGNGILEFETPNGIFDLYLKPDTNGYSTFIGYDRAGRTFTNDLIYRSVTPIDISDFKNDAMTKDGIIIKSYANTRVSDQLEFLVPPDINNYKAILTIAKPI